MKIAFRLLFLRFKPLWMAFKASVVKKKYIILMKNLHMSGKSRIFAQKYA